MAALSTIAAIAALTASAVSVGSTLLAKPPKAPEAPTLPAAPKPEDTSAETEAALTRRSTRRQAQVAGAAPSGRASTLLTGPTGLTQPAPTERKTLLGY